MSFKLAKACPRAFIATGCYLGYLPWMPGTWASLVATIVAYTVVAQVGWWLLCLATAAALPLGWWVSGWVAATLRNPDPPCIVIDEIAAQWLALVPIAWLCPDNWRLYALAFALFRLFDIWKPGEIKWIGERYPGGAGVMLDDQLAALPVVGVVAALVIGSAIIGMPLVPRH